MLFDTHCHLNFKAFDNRIEEVINNAKAIGINQIIVPGTDLETSKKAVEIAEKYDGVYAAVGIHPHHVFELYSKARHRVFSSTSPPKGGSPKSLTQKQVSSLLKLLNNPKVVAVGEVGIDKYDYKKTVYKVYKVHKEFIEMQKMLFKEQIKLAIKYKKALIIHNREAKKDTLEVLSSIYHLGSSIKAVFHCCEPDEELLEFAKNHKMFIGVDGDVVYRKEKQEFIKKVPLEMLVLETDSPYLSPFRKFPNEPKNIKVIAEFVAKLKNVSLKEVEEKTTENARKLFSL
ncbi:MAG: TatD family hydrolase [Candidatus Roizmanbacteria bacterium]